MSRQEISYTANGPVYETRNVVNASNVIGSTTLNTQNVVTRNYTTTQTVKQKVVNTGYTQQGQTYRSQLYANNNANVTGAGYVASGDNYGYGFTGNNNGYSYNQMKRQQSPSVVYGTTNNTINQGQAGSYRQATNFVGGSSYQPVSSGVVTGSNLGTNAQYITKPAVSTNVVFNRPSNVQTTYVPQTTFVQPVIQQQSYIQPSVVQTVTQPVYTQQQTFVTSQPIQQTQVLNQNQWVQQQIQRPQYSKLYNNNAEYYRNLAPEQDPTVKKSCCSPCCWILWGLLGLLALLFGILCGLGVICPGFNLGLPKLSVPGLPSIGPITPPTLPDVKLPDVKLPDVKLPDVKLPDVKLPDVKLPDVKLPDVKLPVITPPIVNPVTPVVPPVIDDNFIAPVVIAPIRKQVNVTTTTNTVTRGPDVYNAGSSGYIATSGNTGYSGAYSNSYVTPTNTYVAPTNTYTAPVQTSIDPVSVAKIPVYTTVSTPYTTSPSSSYSSGSDYVAPSSTGYSNTYGTNSYGSSSNYGNNYSSGSNYIQPASSYSVGTTSPNYVR